MRFYDRTDRLIIEKEQNRESFDLNFLKCFTQLLGKGNFQLTGSSGKSSNTHQEMIYWFITPEFLYYPNFVLGCQNHQNWYTLLI